MSHSGKERMALAELVRLKDLRDKLDEHDHLEPGAAGRIRPLSKAHDMRQDYLRNKAAAWDAAREVLGRSHESNHSIAIDDSPAYGIIDPDYARVYTQARIVAWSYGYACVMHGSFTRDLDLLMVPWEDRAMENHEQLLKLIAQSCGLLFRDGQEDVLKSKADFSEKPHGRKACSLFFPGFDDRRWVDISFMPCRRQKSEEEIISDAQDAARYRGLRDIPATYLPDSPLRVWFANRPFGMSGQRGLDELCDEALETKSENPQ